MPTEVIRHVDASATGAADGTSLADAYTTLSACLTAEAKDLVTADEQLTVLIYNVSGGITEASNTSINSGAGWDTDTTRRIRIVGAIGHYAGIEYDSSKALVEYTDGGVVMLRDVSVEGVQLRAIETGASQTLVSPGSGGDGYRELKNCHLIYAGSGGSSNKCVNFTGDVGLLMQNCIVKGWPDTSTVDNNRTGGVSYIYKNTFVDNASTVLDWSGASADLVVAKENLFSGNATDAAGTFAAGTDRNATDNATIGYTVTGGGNTNDRLSQTFTFESATDYKLASGDTGGKDLGTDLSGDANYPVVVDITNTPRPSPTTDIGAADDADTTPPALSAYTETSITGSGATVGCSTNEVAGTLACVITTSATAPTVQEILDGNATGTVYNSTIELDSSGAKTFAATFGPGGVDYYAHMVHRDSGNNDSNIISSPAAINLVPTITSFGTGNIVREGVQITVSGDGFGASQLSGTIEITDGTHTDSITVNSWADETVTGTWTQPTFAACPFSDSQRTITGRLITDAGLNDSVTVDAKPASGRIAAPLSVADADQNPGSVLETATVSNGNQVNVPLSYVSTVAPFNTVNISWEYSNGFLTGRQSLDPGAGGSFDGSYTIEHWRTADGSVLSSVVTVAISGLSPDDGFELSFEDPVTLIALMTIDEGHENSFGDAVALQNLLTPGDHYEEAHEDPVALSDITGVEVNDHYEESFEDQGQIVQSYWATVPPSTRIITLR